jgi:5-methylthioadenosine/S-adenosylhomocysteine deaminase
VKGSRILSVGPYEEIIERFIPRNVIGGSGKVVLPGLINTHTHAAMVYFRGIADDLPLKEWLEKYIWPAESKWLSTEFCADAVTLACVEMLKSGVTTYNDMYFFQDGAARVTREMGMRAVLGVGVLDFPSVSAKTTEEYLANAEVFLDKWKGDGLVTPCVAPHAPYTCSPETFKKAKTLAEKYDVPLHTHLSETRYEVDTIKERYGKTPVEYLDEIGFLDRRLVAAHCVWVDDKDIGILARRGVGVSHCVESNLKLASGISPVARMVREGVKVTFGTDGAASNNDLDIFTEMSIAARLHKAIAGDPTVLDARQTLAMATRIGAEVLGLESTVGSIASGKAADIVVADLNKPHLTPFYDIYSLIVYSMRASDVDTVMVDGKIVVQNRTTLTADEGAVMEKAWWWKNRIAPG